MQDKVIMERNPLSGMVYIRPPQGYAAAWNVSGPITLVLDSVGNLSDIIGANRSAVSMRDMILELMSIAVANGHVRGDVNISRGDAIEHLTRMGRRMAFLTSEQIDGVMDYVAGWAPA